MNSNRIILLFSVVVLPFDTKHYLFIYFDFIRLKHMMVIIIIV